MARHEQRREVEHYRCPTGRDKARGRCLSHHRGKDLWRWFQHTGRIILIDLWKNPSMFRCFLLLSSIVTTTTSLRSVVGYLVRVPI